MNPVGDKTDVPLEESEVDDDDPVLLPQSFPPDYEEKIVHALTFAATTQDSGKRFLAVQFLVLSSQMNSETFRYSYCFPSYCFLERFVKILQAAQSANDLRT